MRGRLVIILLVISTLCKSQSLTFTPFDPALPRPLFQRPDTVTLVFLGDVMMHRDQISNARRNTSDSYDFSTYFSNIKGIIGDADAAVANMEFTLGGKPYTGYPCFSAPDNYPDYVAGCGVDVFLTANNHILDKGKKGIERTLGIYDRMEDEGTIQYTGTAMDAAEDSLRNPLVIPVKGIRIALVNFSYGTNAAIKDEFPKVNRIDTAEIAAAVRRARDQGAEFVIALPHWGTEYVLKHSRSEERMAEWLAQKGCDAVIGSHPHVVQDIGTVCVSEGLGRKAQDVPVIYSLGNIISNMSAANTQIGLIATIKLVTDKFGDRALLPPTCTFTWCTRPGTLTDSYSTIPVKKYLGKRELWRRTGDYDKMVTSYERIKNTTGIIDFEN